jgi:hypothetical protein
VSSLLDLASLMEIHVPERPEEIALEIAPLALRQSAKLHKTDGILNGGWCKVCEPLRCSLGGTGTAHRVGQGILASGQSMACICVTYQQTIKSSGHDSFLFHSRE